MRILESSKRLGFLPDSSLRNESDELGRATCISIKVRTKRTTLPKKSILLCCFLSFVILRLMSYNENSSKDLSDEVLL